MPLAEIMEIVKDHLPWPVSDVLHLLKCARSHLLNHMICLFPASMTCVNLSLLEETLKIGKALSDKSREGRMKDAYALSLFSWESLISLYDNKRYDAAYYLLPFTMMNEAII